MKDVSHFGIREQYRTSSKFDSLNVNEKIIIKTFKNSLSVDHVTQVNEYLQTYESY